MPRFAWLIFILAAVCSSHSPATAAADPPELDYTTTWLGDSADASQGKWVQNWANDLAVSPDGTVYTNGSWDEHDRTSGVYRDGKVIDTHHLYMPGKSGHTIAIDENYIYVNRLRRGKQRWYGITRYSREDYTPAKFEGGPNHEKLGKGPNTGAFLPVCKGRPSFGMACRDGRLYVSDLVNGRILVVDTGTMRKVGSFGDFVDEAGRESHPLDLAVAPDGNVWNIEALVEHTVAVEKGVSVKGAMSTSGDMRAGAGIHVACVPVEGDTEVVARVETLRPQGHKDPLVGVFLCDTLRDDTPFTWMRLINHKTSRFVRRKKPGGGVAWAGQGDMKEVPVWFRLRREEGEVTAWESSDGRNWQRVGRAGQVHFEGRDYIGLAVRSYKMDEPSTAGFSNLRVNGESVPFEQLRHTDLGEVKVSGDLLDCIRRHTGSTVTRRIREYTPDGRPTGRQVTAVPCASDIAFHPDGRLFVTDDGPDQRIKIFDVSDDSPRQVGTLGRKGGVFSGAAGKYGPYKLNGPNAVAIDPDGNVYVASGALSDPWDRVQWGMWSNWHTDLRAFSGPEKQGGKLLWKALGLMFVDAAVVDPRSPEDIYTMETHMTMDWSPMPGDADYRPGGEWGEVYDQIHDGFTYPDDCRHRWGGTTPVAIRYVGGRPFMFTTSMRAAYLSVYRLRADGEVSAPAAMVATSPRTGSSWPREAPRTPGKGMAPWLWVDNDGDGGMQAGEFCHSRMSAYPASNGGWDADADGAIWHVSSDGIERLPADGLNDAKAPAYDMSSMQEFDYPEPFTQVRRLEYRAENDTLYLAGYTKEHGEISNDWKAGGAVLARYDDWLAGNREPAWTTVLPYEKKQKPAGFCHDGEEWLYVGYGNAPTRGMVRVYAAADGNQIGEVSPGPNVAGFSGLLDVPHPVRAFVRDNGERILMVEEDGMGRILVYRIQPPE